MFSACDQVEVAASCSATCTLLKGRARALLILSPSLSLSLPPSSKVQPEPYLPSPHPFFPLCVRRYIYLPPPTRRPVVILSTSLPSPTTSPVKGTMPSCRTRTGPWKGSTPWSSSSTCSTSRASWSSKQRQKRCVQVQHWGAGGAAGACVGGRLIGEGHNWICCCMRVLCGGTPGKGGPRTDLYKGWTKFSDAFPFVSVACARCCSAGGWGRREWRRGR